VYHKEPSSLDAPPALGSVVPRPASEPFALPATKPPCSPGNRLTKSNLCSSTRTTRPRAKPELVAAAAAAAGHHRVSAHGGAAVRGPREEHRGHRRGARGDKEIFLAAQKRQAPTTPPPDDIFDVGTIGTIHQFHRSRRHGEGARRGPPPREDRRGRDEDHFLCEVEPLDEPVSASVEVEALMRSVQSTFETYVKLNKRVPPEMLMTVQTIDEPGAARGHGGRAPREHQARRPSGAPGDHRPGRAARALHEVMQARSRSCRSRRRSARA
jgi:hypothetical protein